MVASASLGLPRGVLVREAGLLVAGVYAKSVRRHGDNFAVLSSNSAVSNNYRTIARDSSCDDGKDVEKEMLKAGLAWHYLAFSNDPERQALEDQAKAEKLNIWSEAGPVAPWDWRKWGTAKRKNWLAQSTTPASTKTMATASKAPAAMDYWLNTKSSVRHNAGCRWFNNTKSGRHCTDSEGHACHQCGG